MSTYVEGSNKGKVIFYSLLLLFVLILAFLYKFTVFIPPEGSALEMIEKNVELTLYIAISNFVFFIFYSCLAVWAGKVTIKHGTWPPPQIPVPFRTKIILVKKPYKAWLLVFITILLLSVPVGTGFYGWYMSDKLHNDIKELRNL